MSAPEFRTDPITGRVAILVPGRSARPNEHALPPPTATADPNCPFCEGSEGKTPAEVAVVAPAGRPPNSPGWHVRAIPNRFPTVTEEVVPTPATHGASQASPSPAFGYHEVVIESPAHAPSLGYLPLEQVARVIRTCRDRVRELSRRPHVGTVTLFENTGPESGGSLWHPHAQIVTVPELSPALREEIAGADSYRARTGCRCALEAVLADEVKSGERRVFASGAFVGYTPFASTVPYEVRVMPTRHMPSFGDMTDEEATVLAGDLSALLQAFLSVLPGASYNYAVRSPGGSTPETKSYHWHLDFLPRLIRPDGFDLGSGYSVNTVLPEVAAETLRASLAAKR